MKNRIDIKNAHIHNLKGVNVSVPKHKLTVITGVSGSGKSSLAFDTLYEEGRKRYLMFSGTQIMVEKESIVDEITGLSPTVAVEQRIIRQSNPRSTVGTRTQVELLLAALFASFGVSDQGFEPKEPLKAQMFQKNSPRGMCPKCMGKGHYYVLDEERLLPDKDIRVDSMFSDICDTGMMWRYFEKYRRTFHAPTDKKFSELTEEEYNNLMYEETPHFEGLALWLPKVYEWGRNSASSWCRKIDCVDRVECKRCEGTGLSREAAHTRVGGKTISELENMYISDLYEFLHKLPGEKSPLQKELEKKLACLAEVGLHHLSLSRVIPSLSGGEIQRLFLASYILAEMDSIIFIFDEPTIGLHEKEKEKLIAIIRRLIEGGNTVVCVEHDESFIREADYIIDVGPGAGVLGGLKIYEGGYKEFLACKDSVTAPYLADNCFLIKRAYREVGAKKLTIKNTCLHNLQNVTVDIPLGGLIGIAGVSGSGKSSLISDTLVPYLKEMMRKNCVTDDDNEHTKTADDEDIFDNIYVTDYSLPDTEDETIIEGTENIKRCYVIDQRPIGRSRTSCPATYTGIMDRIRKIFADSPMAKEKGYDIGYFSLNSKGKSTMVQMLAERYDLIACGENYHSKVTDIVADPELQPDLCYIRQLKDWKEFVMRSPQEYERWVYNIGNEVAGFEVAELIRLSKDKRVIVDTNIPIKILKEISDYRHVAVMLSPQSMSVDRFFDRNDPEKQFILNVIEQCEDSDTVMKNYKAGLERINSKEHYDEYANSGFFTIVRENDGRDSRAEVCDRLAKHFGLLS